MRLCDVDADGCTEANRRVRGTGKEGSRVCTLVCAHPRVCVCVCLCVATACSLVHTYHVTHAVFLLCDAFVCPQDRWQMGVHTARDKRTDAWAKSAHTSIGNQICGCVVRKGS